MNELIKELIVQSDNGQFHNGKCYPHIGSRTLEDWAKFAELIVRECSGIYEAIDNGNKVEGTDNYIEALRKRFGIKE